MASITVPITGNTDIDLAAISAAVTLSFKTPPPPPPPPALADYVILQDGKTFYKGNWNYGNLMETDGVTFAGELCSEFIATASGGGGGYLPYFELPNIDTTGYNYRRLRMASTRPGQVWLAVQPYMHAPNPTDTGDLPVPGTSSVNVNSFGPTPVPGEFFDYYIPLRAGGYNMNPTQVIKKAGIQDQINSGGGNPTLGHNNTWYIAYDALTVTKP
jgi:hypothetical protein